jgi:hypothetical protein
MKFWSITMKFASNSVWPFSEHCFHSDLWFLLFVLPITTSGIFLAYFELITVGIELVNVRQNTPSMVCVCIFVQFLLSLCTLKCPVEFKYIVQMYAWAPYDWIPIFRCYLSDRSITKTVVASSCLKKNVSYFCVKTFRNVTT